MRGCRIHDGDDLHVGAVITVPLSQRHGADRGRHHGRHGPQRGGAVPELPLTDQPPGRHRRRLTPSPARPATGLLLTGREGQPIFRQRGHLHLRLNYPSVAHSVVGEEIATHLMPRSLSQTPEGSPRALISDDQNVRNNQGAKIEEDVVIGAQAKNVRSHVGAEVGLPQGSNVSCFCIGPFRGNEPGATYLANVVMNLFYVVRHGSASDYPLRRHLSTRWGLLPNWLNGHRQSDLHFLSPLNFPILFPSGFSESPDSSRFTSRNQELRSLHIFPLESRPVPPLGLITSPREALILLGEKFPVAPFHLGERPGSGHAATPLSQYGEKPRPKHLLGGQLCCHGEILGVDTTLRRVVVVRLGPE